MPPIHHSILVAAMSAACSHLAFGDLTVEVGAMAISEGTPLVTVPVTVIGSDPLTDMNVIIQIGDGGSLTGSPPVPVVTSIGFGSSIWQTAPGGFVAFFASSAPPAEIVDPSVSLLKVGESVTASGTLMSLTINTTTFPIGDYSISLSGTIAGDSELLDNGEAVTTTFLPGSISILPAIEHWRLEHFLAAVENPLLQSTLWGDDADPDLDGLNNLLEFAYGTDPNTPGHNSASTSKTGIPSSTVTEIAGNRFLEICYSRRRTATGLNLHLSSSATQIDWQSPAPGLSQVGSPVQIGDLLYELVRFRLPIPSQSQNHFVRLSASQTP